MASPNLVCRQHVCRRHSRLILLLLLHRDVLRRRRRLLLLTAVLPQVPKHVPFFNERLSAIRARMRPFAAVRPPMGHQMSFAHEVLLAEVAPERPVRRRPFIVRSLMEKEVAFQRERFPTFGAGEGSFAGVRSHVID